MNTATLTRRQIELARFFSRKNRQRVAAGKRAFYVFPAAMQFSCGEVIAPTTTPEEITHEVTRRRSSAPKAPQQPIILRIQQRGAA